MSSPTRETSRWLVLILVCFAQFMVVVDATVVNVALPSIQADLGFSAANLQWVVNGYTLVFGGFLLLGGRASDLLGRKRLFLGGLTLFTAASALNGLASSQEMLVAARALQGLGAAMVSPAALSIITTTFEDGPERTRALGIWSGIIAGGAAFGLLFGGVLTEALSWPWVFFVNVPVGIAVGLAALRYVPESKTDDEAGFDLAGAVTVTSGLMILTYAIVKAQEWGWTGTNTLVLGGLAFALLGAFVAIERRAASPLVQLRIFSIRTLSVANGVMLLIGGALFSMFFFGSLYVQDVLGFSPLESGLAFLPMSVGIAIGAGVAQAMIGRVGVKTVALGGMLLATAGMVLMTGVSAGGSYVSDVLPGTVLIALGMGNVFVPLTLAATTNVDDAHAGLASGIFNTSQQIGGALGLAILSTLAADRTAAVGGGTPAAMVEGFQTAFLVGAGMMAVGAIALAVLLRQRDVAHISVVDAVPVAA
ncbi:MAG: MFS transporter [Solirubrobacteraceae bacterium]|nr:MFS transporter [Solirubrobacteraceae bacterium]